MQNYLVTCKTTFNATIFSLTFSAKVDYFSMLQHLLRKYDEQQELRILLLKTTRTFCTEKSLPKDLNIVSYHIIRLLLTGSTDKNLDIYRNLIINDFFRGRKRLLKNYLKSHYFIRGVYNLFDFTNEN